MMYDINSLESEKKKRTNYSSVNCTVGEATDALDDAYKNISSVGSWIVCQAVFNIRPERFFSILFAVKRAAVVRVRVIISTNNITACDMYHGSVRIKQPRELSVRRRRN